MDASSKIKEIKYERDKCRIAGKESTRRERETCESAEEEGSGSKGDVAGGERQDYRDGERDSYNGDL